VGVLALFVLWTWLSSFWSPDPTASILQGEQVLVFLFGVAGFIVVVHRDSLSTALVALVAGTATICLYSLSTRLFPDQLSGNDTIAGYRLTRPVGYWNALGLYAAIGLAVAVGLAIHGPRITRAVMAAMVPVFALTVYFTYSRGSVLALALGLLVTFALDERRLDWLLGSIVLALPAAVVVIVASRSGPLTKAGHTIPAAARDGHRLALLALVLALLAAGIAAWAPQRHLQLRSGQRALLTATVWVAIAAVLVVGLVVAGGPSGIKDKFVAAPPATNGNLNKRLFSISSSYRTPLWSQAWREYTAHPIAGGGAGSYESYYLEHRTRADKVKNAHNLYLETLAELGPLGLALLLVALLSPLYAAVKARRHLFGPALAGAYVTFLVHLAVDWDWQVTGVALTGLFCGAAILVAARSDADEQRELSPRLRYGLLGATLLVMVVAFVGLVGNMSLSQASAAAGKGDWTKSEKDAKRAHTWAPWSSEPYRQLGEAQLGQGDTKAAIASFDKAIAKGPDDWNLWFDLARATTGKAQRQALQHAKQLNPLSPEIAELQKEIDAEKVITVVPKSPVQP
ncbi:MAG TPA: O-antigen ligase family protein, partial [Gaiellaceae bacterium]|nr:O-antigen ligase family protein [Gaiellaceae bacterium]